MLIVADSGSTKCDWVILDEAGKELNRTTTSGINPFFTDSGQIVSIVKADAQLHEVAGKITRIFFYGAGCSSEAMCRMVEEGLGQVFLNAVIRVDHDLLASAMATYDGRPGISCILGTGSNSCFFDGKAISEEVPSLAYILGDEASGSYFGKIILREYFYKKMPHDLRAAFEKDWQPQKQEVMQRIYGGERPNAYLASFMKFFTDHQDHPHVRNHVTGGMRHFIDIHVKCFEGWQQFPVHFIGSIAFIFRDCLHESAAEEGITIGNVISKPIDSLVDYHRKYIF